MLTRLPGLRKLKVEFSGGLDEYSAVSDILVSEAIEMENFRLSKDGKRVEKRLGLAEEVTRFGATITGAGIAFVNSNPDTITDNGGGFVTAGFLDGMSIDISGAGEAGNNATFTIATVVAGTMTLIGDDALTAESLGETVTIVITPEDVYGYSTYYDSDSAYNELAVLQSQIHRKVGAGDWSAIHAFSSAVNHPVDIVQAQGKQFIIQENDSRMIHTDKADYQIGITAPTTIPTGAEVAETFITTNLNIDEDFNDLSAWTDNSNNGSASATQTQPTGADEGPEGDDWYLYLTDDGSVASGEHATLDYTTIDAFPPVFDLEYALYIETYGYKARDSALYITIYTGFSAIKIIHHGPFIGFWNGYDWNWHHHRNYKGKWATFKYHIDASDPNGVGWQMYKDGVADPGSDKSGESWSLADNTAPAVQIKAMTEAEVDYYIDYFKIAGSSVTSTGETGNLNGQYRYAITYARSGNFGCESNPIYSLIGSTTYTQGDSADHDDLTVSGTYEGEVDINIRVQITTEGTPDKMKWSADGGESWYSENVLLTTNPMYLSYGIALVFDASTGHEVGDIWDFTCSALSVTCTSQRVKFTNIPTNSNDLQIDQRKIYRTLSNGAKFYWLATISDNTTTTFEDNFPDTVLGSRLREDRDILPNGKFSLWWDDRLWVLDVPNDIAYYSRIGVPEEFDTDVRYITFRQKKTDDELTGWIVYKDALYVFKRQAIYIILKQPGGTYGRYLINTDYGCVAPWSLTVVNDSIMFLSFRGWEIYYGYESDPKRLSLLLDRTFGSIDTTKYDLITTVHLKNRSEVWLSLPDGTVAVYNYMKGRFYLFSFYKTPSCLVECRNSSKALVVKMGTTDGYLDLCESGYQDGSTAITATLRKPWIETEKYADIIELETEFEMPTNMTLTLNVYENFDKDVAQTASLSGATPASTDRELRRPIRATTELGQSAKYFCFEYINAENLGGDLKINKAYLYYRPRTKKGEIKGD